MTPLEWAAVDAKHALKRLEAAVTAQKAAEAAAVAAKQSTDLARNAFRNAQDKLCIEAHGPIDIFTTF